MERLATAEAEHENFFVTTRDLIQQYGAAYLATLAEGD